MCFSCVRESGNSYFVAYGIQIHTHTHWCLVCSVVSQSWGRFGSVLRVFRVRMRVKGLVCCVVHWAVELKGVDGIEVAKSGMWEWIPPCSCVR